MLTPIIFILILGLLVLSHEFGHFIAAKKAGMRVDEFAFGFPPKLFSWRRGETVYSVNLIPFGGFVRIHGEDYEVTETAESVADRARRFTARPKGWQTLVISAGVICNLLLAWVLLSLGFMVGFPATVTPENKETITNVRVMVVEVQPNSPASLAGLKTGDVITGITTEGVTETITSPEMVTGSITKTKGPLTVNLLRGSEIKNISVTPVTKAESTESFIGIAMDSIGTVRLSAPEAIFQGAIRTGTYAWLTLKGFFNLIHDAILGRADLASLSGPVGIYFLVSDAAALGFSYLIGFTAIISVSLAVINILPLPALDGGRLFILLIESIRRKPLADSTVAKINAIGFFVLIGLMLLVSYHDLLKYF
jgi:regulator of sigma E protease